MKKLHILPIVSLLTGMKGAQFKSWRKNRDLSREQAGEEFGVSAHTVAKWEQDKNPIPIAVQRLIAQNAEIELPLEAIEQLYDQAHKTGKPIPKVIGEIVQVGLKTVSSTSTSPKVKAAEESAQYKAAKKVSHKNEPPAAEE